jgi:hypothetical protein
MENTTPMHNNLSGGVGEKIFPPFLMKKKKTCQILGGKGGILLASFDFFNENTP